MNEAGDGIETKQARINEHVYTFILSVFRHEFSYQAKMHIVLVHIAD